MRRPPRFAGWPRSSAARQLRHSRWPRVRPAAPAGRARPWDALSAASRAKRPRCLPCRAEFAALRAKNEGRRHPLQWPPLSERGWRAGHAWACGHWLCARTRGRMRCCRTRGGPRHTSHDLDSLKKVRSQGDADSRASSASEQRMPGGVSFQLHNVPCLEFEHYYYYYYYYPLVVTPYPCLKV